jgi:hypothetical protein
MAGDMRRDQGHARGERLNDGLSAVAAGKGPPLVILPGLGREASSGIPGARLLLLPGRGHVTALYDPRLKPAIAAFLAEPS